MTEIPPVFDFQTSIETIRAHHWRSFTDAYTGCAFNCQYCLYKGPDDYGRHVRATTGSAAASGSLGILDIGTSTDPYQPIEADERRTRGILEAAVEHKIPVFVLTRGTMVTRDVDILQDLADEGLVEVCFSVITRNEELAAALEVRAPRPAERIAAATELADRDIPVTFHTAPVIPGMNSPDELRALGAELAEISGRHVFAAMLGAQRAYWDSFTAVVDGVAAHFHSIERFRNAYPTGLELVRASAVTCSIDDALVDLEPFREGVVSAGATFVSENYPYLTTGALDGGIYRWKLPTVFDMASWVADQEGAVDWAEFRRWYVKFEPSEALIGTVESCWNSGELFVGTTLSRGISASGPTYERGEVLISPARRTLVARRGRRS
jgi:DNA repair photolyase